MLFNSRRKACYSENKRKDTTGLYISLQARERKVDQEFLKMASFFFFFTFRKWLQARTGESANMGKTHTEGRWTGNCPNICLKRLKWTYQQKCS